MVGLIGCEDNDQDGWAENTASFVGGDKFPKIGNKPSIQTRIHLEITMVLIVVMLS